MIVTTYTCDKCGHSQTKDDQMWTIGIVVASRSYSIGDGDMKTKALWCRACVEKLHLLPQYSAKPAAIPPAPPTLEEMIREIMREEISASAAATQ